MADGFAKLKKDLIFHEKRLQLLLSTRIVDDLDALLQEKTQVRAECTADCLDAREKFEKAASQPKLSGRWNDLQVSNFFKLEVPLRFVVGSLKFEAPEGQDTQMLQNLMKRLSELSQRYPEFQHAAAAGDVEAFIDKVRSVTFTARDVQRMNEAVSSKLAIISELDDLTNVLQESGFAIAKLRSEIEACRDEDAKARDAGEIAISEDAIRRKIGLLEKLIDTIFFQVHTIESTVETNVSRRQSNVTLFQSSAAMLECIRREKEELSRSCISDIGRIERGMAFEAGVKENGRDQVLQQQRESAAKIASIETQQQALSDRLRQLVDEFIRVEQSLQVVSAQRASAIAAHIELVEKGRHATSDFLELDRYADAYKANLAATRAQYDEGVTAIKHLENVLLQQQDFATFDFNASGHRLQAMRRKVCSDLNAALNALESGASELIRRRQAQIRNINEAYDVAFCEAELRKEMLDPMTKKHVLRVKELEDARTTLESEIAEIQAIVERQKTICSETIRMHLAEEEVSLVDDEVQTRALQSRETLADLRQSLLESRDSDRSLAMAQSDVIRTVQTGAPIALPPPHSSESTRSTVVSAANKRSSRVKAVREEVARALMTPHSRRATESPHGEPGQFTGGGAADDAVQPTAQVVEKGPSRRPIRVIGASSQSVVVPDSPDAMH